MPSVRATGAKPKQAPVRPTSSEAGIQNTARATPPETAAKPNGKRSADLKNDVVSPEPKPSKRLRQGVEQFPIQILVPEETRDALRRRSEDTGASIRHIILRSLAADGIPVPAKPRQRK
jgi:hypothetical protein